MSKFGLVTGATSGIGKAFAERLAADGYDLVIAGRRQDRLAEFAGSHPEAKVRTAAADLSTEAGVDTVARICATEPLTMLVNNAGPPTTCRSPSFQPTRPGSSLTSRFLHPRCSPAPWLRACRSAARARSSTPAPSGVAAHDAGVASATMNTGQQLGGSIGTSLLNTIFASTVASYIAAHLSPATVVHGQEATLDPLLTGRQERRTACAPYAHRRDSPPCCSCGAGRTMVR